MKTLPAKFLLSVMVVAATCLAADVNAAAKQSLLTTQQQALDKVAMSLQADSAVKAAREAAFKRWSEQHAATTADGKATLAGAIDELVYHSLRAAAADDPLRPVVGWTLAPPYALGALGKTKITGSRFAGDNPDRIYRYAAIDPAWHYEIRGKRGLRPAQHEFSFESTSSISLIAPPLVALFSRDVDVAQDGSFVVTVDSTPADGRRNHLQLPDGARAVLFRDTLPDWSTDYNSVSITRVDGGGGGDDRPAARSHDELVKSATAIINAAAVGTIFLFDAADKHPANEIVPFVRPVKWGVPGNVIGMSRFSLAADEALVITLLPSGANYVGIQLADPWSRAVDYWNHTSSLSNHQAKANGDGSITYVLSAQDPGVYNWLDNGGLHDGTILTRWELFANPLPPGDAPQLVREARVVKLSELAAALPDGMAKVTPAQRKQQLKTRAAEFAKRVALK